MKIIRNLWPCRDGHRVRFVGFYPLGPALALQPAAYGPHLSGTVRHVSCFLVDLIHGGGDDAPGDNIFPAAISWFEDIAFIDGSGVGQPLGVMNSPALVSVAKETGQDANSIVWENLINMFARMLPASLNSAVWLAHIDTFPQLATMSLAVGTGGSAIWMNNGVEGPPMTILGRPVIFTEKMQTVGGGGSGKDIAFVDFSYYLIGDRQQMRAESSSHAQFAADITVFRIIERVDGRGWLQSAITPRNGTNTLSPFVTLDERG